MYVGRINVIYGLNEYGLEKINRLFLKLLFCVLLKMVFYV